MMTITFDKRNEDLKDVGESIALDGVRLLNDSEGRPYSLRFLFTVKGYTTVDPQEEVLGLNRIIAIRETHNA